MHVGPSVLDSSVPVTAKRIHYDALRQRGISPEEARAWIEKEYNPTTVANRPLFSDMVRPLTAAALVVGTVTGLSLVTEVGLLYLRPLVTAAFSSLFH